MEENVSSAPTPDMPREVPLEDAIKQGLDDESHCGEADSFTIFRVPAHARDEDSRLYEPRLVSIGPYSRGRDKLHAMEQHKWRYLRHLLQRAAGVPLRRSSTVPLPANLDPLGAFIRAIRAVEHRARRCYSEAPGADGDKFAEMLLLDGCFILEFFFKWNKVEPDKLCDAGWAFVLLNSDLLLMENQVPFFVLEELFDAFYCGRVPRNVLTELLLQYLKPNGAVLARQSQCPAPTGSIDHLLHLYHEAFVARPLAVISSQASPQTAQPVTSSQTSPQAAQPVASSQASPQPPRVIPCVTALRDAGVRFVKKQSPAGMFDITFDSKRGVMEMPPVAINQASLPLLVNLIAFEQSMDHRSRTGSGAPLTSYAALMSLLVRTGKDVEELQARGIVDNMLSSNEDAAAKFFQSMGACSTLNYDDHMFATLFADVKRYHDKVWHRHSARFMRKHCSNPCSIIAFVLAVVAVLLSIIFSPSVAVYNLVHHSKSQ